MRLYFLRHGLAGDRETWQGDDFARPLTGAGRERMAREAKTIARLQLGLELIVTSPLVRAQQTAAIVADALKMRDRLIEDARLGHEFDAAALAAVLAEHRDVETSMLVGHEPSMSETIAQLVGGGRLDFKKGALARVDLAGAEPLSGRLVWIVPPSVLAL